MSIIFTLHVKKRMNERGISAEQIRECIFYPSRAWTERDGGNYFQKSFKDGMLEIVAEQKGKHYIVITAYYL